MLRLGYKASAEQFGPRKLLDFTIEAEQAGFDSAFVSDHLQPWRHSDGHAPFAFAWLGAAGERTSRILLGTSVTTVVASKDLRTVTKCRCHDAELQRLRAVAIILAWHSARTPPSTTSTARSRRSLRA